MIRIGIVIDDGICLQPQVLELDICRVTAVRHYRALDAHTRAISIHQEQGQAIGIAVCARSASDQHQLVRAVPIEDKSLAAVDDENVAVAIRERADV